MTQAPPMLDYAPRPVRPPGSLVALGALTLCCVFWGYSFPVMQIATSAFDRHVLRAGAGGGGGAGEAELLASRALFNGVRFGLAGALYALVTFRKQRGYSRDEVVGGAAVGTLFAAGMLLQVSGLRWALPSVSSFLTALPVVFAPLAQAALFGRPVGRRVWLAAGAAGVGIVLLSWPKPEAVAAAANALTATPPVPYLGEMLTVAGSIIFTAQIMAVDHFGRRSDPVRLTMVMLATTAALSLATGVTVGGGGGMLRGDAVRSLAADPRVLWTMSTLIVFSSVCALHLMNVYQPSVTPAIASVIYCTEPLFGTLFSLGLGTERLAVLTVAGGAAVVASVYVVASAPRPPERGHV
jgi:drug/metabolite transporter (DMT)-like permease